jgi:hypothetical protein
VPQSALFLKILDLPPLLLLLLPVLSLQRFGLRCRIQLSLLLLLSLLLPLLPLPLLLLETSCCSAEIFPLPVEVAIVYELLLL